MTRLAAAGVGAGFRLVLDFGTVHGLAEPVRAAVGREVTAVTISGAALLLVSMVLGAIWYFVVAAATVAGHT